MENMWYLDIRIQTFFVFMCGMVGLFKINRLLPFEKLILFIVWQNFFVDLYATYLAEQKISTAWIYNINLVLQHTLTLFIYSALSKKKYKLIFYIFMFLLLTSCTINILFFQQKNFNDYTITVSLLFIAVSSYFIIRDYITTKDDPLALILFWFALGNFFYPVIAINILSSVNILTKAEISIARKLFSVNYFGYIVWSVLITTGLLWNSKKIKSSLL